MTPHNAAAVGDIAKVVLMPGDPLRAKFIAETYLENVKQVNSVRNMNMYTGEYKGKKVSVCASGMGQPSMGIYSYELFDVYGVDKIIRIGTCGSYKEDLKVYDLVLATSSYSDSDSFSKLVLGESTHVQYPSLKLNEEIKKVASGLNIKLHEGRIHSSDVFYASRPLEETLKITEAIAVEMESAALFCNSKKLKKEASCLLTVSDNLVSKVFTTAEERQTSFTKMIELALSTC